MTDEQNLVDILNDHARKRPNQRVYTYIADGDADEVHLSFQELDLQARALAIRLKSLVAPGDRALLLYPSGLEYITAFFGCLYTGVIPVPAYPPRLNRIDQRIQAISNNAQAAIALTTADIMAGMERRSSNMPALENIGWVSTTYPESTDGIEGWEKPDISEDSLAFIQYTSGSTASPKGVMVSHGNIIHNLSSIKKAFEIDPKVNDIGVSWAPLYHDSGLILSALMAVYAGGQLVFMSPTAFAQRPARWLEAITRHKGTISGGPNFALQWCIDRTTPEERAALDLSSWRVAFTGAEPIRSETLNQFTRTFGPCGFRPEAFTPGYGLAESTLMVSSKHQSKNYTTYFLNRQALESGKVVVEDVSQIEYAREFVGCGEIFPDQKVLIVDPATMIELPEGQVGEVWVSSASVAQGYWANVDETRAIFHAHLKDRSDQTFLRTGDLGFIRDGELVITGRLKDIIIINGRNFYAEDIELTIRDIHPALQPDAGAAFAVEIDGGERLVIVCEVKREYRHANVDEVSRVIRRAIAENHELAVDDIVLIKPLSMPRTTSNKIQRSACKSDYLLNSLERIKDLNSGLQSSDAVTREQIAIEPRTPIEASLCFIWAEVLGIEKVGIYDNFFELGGTSLIATQVASRVEELFQVELPLGVFFETPTVAYLAQYVDTEKQHNNKKVRNPIRRVDRTLPTLCSFSQERLWFLDQLIPENPAYNIFYAMRITGALNIRVLENSLNEVVQRHEILRTNFIEKDGQPVQIISSKLNLSIPIINLHDFSESEQEQQLTYWSIQEAQLPFDLSKDALLRLKLLEIGDQYYILLLTMHHIISDGWSVGVFMNEMADIYEAFSSSEPVSLPHLPIQYADYAQWQREWLQDETIKSQITYWKQQLSGVPTTLALYTDHPRPPIQSYRGATQTFMLPQKLKEKLVDLSRQEGCTLFMTLLAGFDVLLNRYTGQDDFIVGTPVANRNRPELEGLIGYFVNTLALRTNFEEDSNFLELLKQVRKVSLEAFEHQDLPFEKLVEELQPERDLSQMPLVQVMFVLQNAPVPTLKLSDLTLEPFMIDSGTSKFDLSLMMMDTKQGLMGLFEYNADLFDEATIERMAGHYQTLLDGITVKPDRRISELPILTIVERQQLLEEWNETRVDFILDHCIHQRFEIQVDQTPEAVALVYESQQLTYGELNRRANQLAHFLQNKGVGPDVIVGIFIERSLDMVVSILGILKAGGAYVPLDTNNPRERLEFIINETKSEVILTHEGLIPHLPECKAELICLDSDWEIIAREKEMNPHSQVEPEDLAYVIYTSGSTGDPKGVLISHRNVVRLFDSTHPWFQFDKNDVWTLFHSYAFDASVWEIWGALLFGGTLIIVPGWMTRSLEDFYELLRNNHVTILTQTPGAFQQIMFIDERANGNRINSLRLINIGGEALKTGRLRPWFNFHGDQHPQIVNMYGATETTVIATYRPLTMADLSSGSSNVIGKHLPDVNIYILDAHLQLVPIGVPGEIYVGGACLAQGYLNRFELTSERFIPNPFKGTGESRLYRTGDLARYTASGDIEFLGRADQQVKIRGYRVEPEEVETLLRLQPAIREAVVLPQDDQLGEKILVAFIVPKPGATLSSQEIRTGLKKKLPDYMIPSAFVMLEAIPLTPNGKVDRRSLPKPDLSKLILERDYAAPQTFYEEVLAGIWADVLELERVGIYNNFFELGGHSLLATQIISRVREHLQVELPLRVMFETPTISAIAREIETTVGDNSASKLPPIEPIIPRPSFPPLSYAQERMWILYELAPEGVAYNIPLAVRIRGELDIDALRKSLQEISRRHESLRTTIKMFDGHPYQSIAPPDYLALPIIDFNDYPSDLRENELIGTIIDRAQEAFNLEHGPLYKVVLFRLSANEFVLFISLHHVIADQWSFGIFGQELSALYRAYCKGETSPLPEPLIQYSDFALWQRKWIRGEILDEQLRYWRKQLEGLPALELPLDKPRPAIQSIQGAIKYTLIPSHLIQSVRTLGQQERATLFMVLVAGFNILLSRYTNQTDIPIGIPIANRTRIEIEGLIGTFVNSLVLRTDLSGQISFRELIRRVRQVTLDAYAHQDYSFEKLVEELQPERDASRTPLFQVFCNMIDYPFRIPVLDGLDIEPLQLEKGAAQFDLTVSFSMEPEPMIILAYNTDLFEEASAARLLSHYLTLLTSVTINPDQLINDIQILSEAESHQLLVEWNSTRANYPKDLMVHQLFERQVKNKPNHIAVRFEDTTAHLTYEELNKRSNQLARYLRSLGLGSGSVMGIYMRRSLDLVVGLLGVLKAGGTYLPLDPAFPVERLRYMVSDSNTDVILTNVEPESVNNLMDGLVNPKLKIVNLAAEWEKIISISTIQEENFQFNLSSNNLAYMMYTSGTTGKPKGVEIKHQAVVNFLLSMQDKPGLSENDVLLALTTISFDIHVLEIFLPLVTGGQMVLARREVAYDGYRLHELLSNTDATIMQATPATWQLLLESGWPGNSNLKALCGGESLSKDLAFHLLGKVGELWNMYGPTETTVWSTFKQIRSETKLITIGHPISNTQIYILDGNLKPAPIGVKGELFIGGDGLARGYHNLEELTREKFIPNPFERQANHRMYRTGDFARYRSDGQIEWLGRVDHQVKIRGFRIELGEIETVLAEHPDIKISVVSTFKGNNKDNLLVAYFVPNESRLPDRSELRSYLKGKLPDYMIPTVYMPISTIPRTPNGKINYLELPEPKITEDENGNTPRNSVERELLKITEQVLNVKPIGIRSNFFDLGGHSLLAIRLLKRVEAVFGINLPISTIFQAPSVEELARVIQGEVKPPDWSVLVPIQKGGSQRPIFCVHGAGGGIMGYAALAKALGNGQPFYGLQAKGVDSLEEPHDRIEEMAAYYIQQIQRIQPTGPYDLAGYSFGGFVAFEMACQLKDQGHKVGLLAMLDTYALSREAAIKMLWKPGNLIKFLMNLPAWIRDEIVLLFVRNSTNTVIPERKRVLNAHIEALKNYHLRKYDGTISLFRVKTFSLLRSFDPDYGWGEVAEGGVNHYIVSGSHFNMLEEPFVEKLAEQIKKSLAVERSTNKP